MDYLKLESTMLVKVTPFVFTAYSITTRYLSGGSCVTTSGSPVTLTSPYTALMTAFIDGDVDNQRLAETSFALLLGIATCSIGGELIDSTPLGKVPVRSTSPSFAVPTPSLNATIPAPSSHLQTGLTLPQKVGMAVSISITVLMLLGLGILRWRRWKKKQGSKASTPVTEMLDTADDNQPYLQPKAELEDEERRKAELEAEDSRYELDVGGAKVELPALNDILGAADFSEQIRQELRGEEFAGELGSP